MWLPLQLIRMARLLTWWNSVCFIGTLREKTRFETKWCKMPWSDCKQENIGGLTVEQRINLCIPTIPDSTAMHNTASYRIRRLKGQKAFFVESSLIKCGIAKWSHHFNAKFGLRQVPGQQRESSWLLRITSNPWILRGVDFGTYECSQAMHAGIHHLNVNGWPYPD